jgi:hypothetical protein
MSSTLDEIAVQVKVFIGSQTNNQVKTTAPDQSMSSVNGTSSGGFPSWETILQNISSGKPLKPLNAVIHYLDGFPETVELGMYWGIRRDNFIGATCGISSKDLFETMVYSGIVVQTASEVHNKRKWLLLDATEMINNHTIPVSSDVWNLHEGEDAGLILQIQQQPFAGLVELLIRFRQLISEMERCNINLGIVLCLTYLDLFWFTGLQITAGNFMRKNILKSVCSASRNILVRDL